MSISNIFGSIFRTQSVPNVAKVSPVFTSTSQESTEGGREQASGIGSKTLGAIAIAGGLLILGVGGLTLATGLIGGGLIAGGVYLFLKGMKTQFKPIKDKLIPALNNEAKQSNNQNLSQAVGIA